MVSGKPEIDTDDMNYTSIGYQARNDNIHICRNKFHAIILLALKSPETGRQAETKNAELSKHPHSHHAFDPSHFRSAGRIR